MQPPPPESAAPRRTTVGCMAGLLRLFSPYHRSHHRKRLTAKSNAKQQQQPSAPSPAPSPPVFLSPVKKKAVEVSSPSPVAFVSPVKPKKPTPQQQQPVAVTRRRRSCDAPRSPTIAPEHRRRASCDSPRPPSSPAIVARLMGLEESSPPSPAAQRPVLPTRPPPPPPSAPTPPPETAVEKRRKLLGALEKCDEDLKTLRRIIAAVRAAEIRAAAASDVVAPSVAAGTPPPPPGNNKGAAKWVLVGRDEQSPSPSPQSQHQYPSPDSVLDAIVSSPRFPCRKRPSPCTDHDAAGGCGNGAVVPSAAAGTTMKVVKPSRTFVFSGDYCKVKAGGEELQQLHTAVGVHHHPAVLTVAGTTEACTLFRPRLPRSAGAESWRHHRRRWELEAAAAGRVISRAMAESAGEVMWGRQQQHAGGDEQRRECGRVAAALERAILQDLVSDVVAELVAQSGIITINSAGCRKRLCF